MSKPGETEYGKGSFPRIWNSPAFRSNFDDINWGRNDPPTQAGPPYSYGSLGEETACLCTDGCNACVCGQQ